MFVTVLYRLADKLDGPEPEGEPQSFDDVAAGSWYAQAVDWAVRAGITTGIGGGRFAPEDVVTREQMCAFLIRFLAGYMGYDLSAYTGGESFADDSDIPGWAREAVYQARALGLIQGVGENSFNPKGTATRASVAAIMDRLLDKTGELEAAQPEPSPEPSKQPSGGGSGGGGGGGGGGGSTLTALKSVYILRDTADVTGLEVNPGDRLHAYVDPKVEDKTIYTVRWLVGGVEKSTENVYTVTSYDSGKTITVEAAGEAAEGYTGTVTSAATGTVSGKMDVTNTDPNKAPVAVATDADYYTKDESGAATPVQVDETSDISLNIAPPSTDVTQAAEEALKISVGGTEVATQNVAVDVALTLTTTEGDGSTTEQEIHPVGDTTVTLTKSQLGLADDVDLETYTFQIYHTNVNGAAETIEDSDILRVEVNGEQAIRFTLNGLSWIYIGNVPPLTVTFDTQGGSAVPAQQVKLGQYAASPEPPTREGYLFAGWDHDLTQTQIISDITFTARWVQGTTAPENRVSIAPSGAAALPQAAFQGNGVWKAEFDTENTYDADQSYKVAVTPYDGATQYAMADTAQAAMEAQELITYTGLTVDFTVSATDGEGKPIAGTTTKYIKWVNAEGEIVALESVALQVYTPAAQGNYTAPVNRGVGVVEVKLTGAAGAEDMVANHNTSLQGNSGTLTYTLYVSSSLDNGQGGADLTDYSKLQVIFTPFAGESYAGKTVSAQLSYYNPKVGANEDVPVAEAVQADGTLTVTTTGDISAYTAPGEDANRNFNLEVSVGEASQRIQISLNNYVSNRTYTEVDAANLAEIKAALAQEGEWIRVNYTGTEDLVLTEALTIGEGRVLNLSRSNAGLTIGQGGVLTLASSESKNAQIITESLVVESGGVLAANAQNTDQDNYYWCVVSAGSITVKSGGQVNVPAYGFMSLNLMTDGDSGTIYVNQGGQVNVDGMLRFNNHVQLDGTLTATGQNKSYSNQLYGYVEFYQGGDITGSVTVTSGGTFQGNGGVTVAESGSITLQSGWVDLSGAVENNGALTVNGGNLKLLNVGYDVTNRGTITIASGARVDVPGTILVNFGTITGAGELHLGIYDDTRNYEDGNEYVTVPDDQATPSNYSRYTFTGEPADTVNLILTPGSLSNQDSGTCTAVVKTEEMPTA